MRGRLLRRDGDMAGLPGQPSGLYSVRQGLGRMGLCTPRLFPHRPASLLLPGTGVRGAGPHVSTVAWGVPGGPGGVVGEKSRYLGRGVRKQGGSVCRDGWLVRSPGIDRMGLWGWERKP